MLRPRQAVIEDTKPFVNCQARRLTEKPVKQQLEFYQMLIVRLIVILGSLSSMAQTRVFHTVVPSQARNEAHTNVPSQRNEAKRKSASVQARFGSSAPLTRMVSKESHTAENKIIF